MDKLIKIQKELVCQKNQKNTFGNYKYRSCEDILEAVKPLLAENGLLLTLTDEVVEIGGRVYVKAMATITGLDILKTQTVTAYAREAETKKGMDAAQITGAASSYARKYALNGLFLIDDTKDADTQDNRQTNNKPAKQVVDGMTVEATNQKEQELWYRVDEIGELFSKCTKIDELEGYRKDFSKEVNAMPKEHKDAVRGKYGSIKTLIASKGGV